MFGETGLLEVECHLLPGAKTLTAGEDAPEGWAAVVPKFGVAAQAHCAVSEAEQAAWPRAVAYGELGGEDRRHLLAFPGKE